MHTQSTVTWLKVASAIVIGFGGMIALAAHPATSGLTGFLVDLVFWPLDGAQNIAVSEFRVLSAISGGIMVGWGLMLWLLSTHLYLRDPGLARTIILTSVGAWFVVDSTASIVAGAPLNAVLNLGFLFMFYLPLWSGDARPSAAT